MNTQTNEKQQPTPREASQTAPASTRKLMDSVKRHTRRKFTSEEKIRIVLDGLRGEDSIADLCRREGISQGVY